ncbi:hypothetical protein C8R45DRAFT_937098 [Mycena sanguinolenta]|nr:hypothetical protein C8R45DRAFT_937098 [Mycena sanguinolenta]
MACGDFCQVTAKTIKWLVLLIHSLSSGMQALYGRCITFNSMKHAGLSSSINVSYLEAHIHTKVMVKETQNTPETHQCEHWDAHRIVHVLRQQFLKVATDQMVYRISATITIGNA